MVTDVVHFTKGSIVVISPQDGDDPEALARAGQRCRLMRYAESQAGSAIAFVQFSTQGHPVAFRAGDLQLAAEEKVEVAQ